MPGAAVFDLDRTLLRGASGPVISQALRDAGVMSGRSIPGEGLVSRPLTLVRGSPPGGGPVSRLLPVGGDTRPSMILTRQAARFPRGWRRDEVGDAGKQAA